MVLRQRIALVQAIIMFNYGTFLCFSLVYIVFVAMIIQSQTDSLSGVKMNVTGNALEINRAYVVETITGKVYIEVCIYKFFKI